MPGFSRCWTSPGFARCSCGRRCRGSSALEPVLLDEMFADGAAGDEVLLDDLFEHRRVALAVPGAFLIDLRNRPAFADSQAIRLGAQDAALLRQAQLLQPALQELPRRDPPLLFAALGR